MRTELLNKWLKELNLHILECEELSDLITRSARKNMLQDLRRDLVKLRDGVN